MGESHWWSGVTMSAPLTAFWILFLIFEIGAVDVTSKKNQTDSSAAARILNVFNIVTFPNDPCVGNSLTGQYGSCLTASECSSLSGLSVGSCASGFGVCCTSYQDCGGMWNLNNSYWRDSKSMTGSTQSDETSPCTFKVCRSDSDIGQIRLDFETFSLAQPNTVYATGEGAQGLGESRTQCQEAQFRANSSVVWGEQRLPHVPRGDGHLQHVDDVLAANHQHPHVEHQDLPALENCLVSSSSSLHPILHRHHRLPEVLQLRQRLPPRQPELPDLHQDGAQHVHNLLFRRQLDQLQDQRNDIGDGPHGGVLLLRGLHRHPVRDEPSLAPLQLGPACSDSCQDQPVLWRAAHLRRCRHHRGHHQHQRHPLQDWCVHGRR